MANLFNEKRFKDPEAAREYLEKVRWPNGPVCPHCGGMERMHKIAGGRPGLYECGHCRQQSTVTVGTVFERSKISLDKWVFAATLMAASKKGVSSKQIERMLGVTYKTAWFMTHRLREAMKSPGGIMGAGGGTVEADETYIGRKPGRKIAKGFGHKHTVFALVERNGRARSFHVVSNSAKALKPLMDEHVSKDAHLMSDEASHYRKIGHDYASHQSVAHGANEYVRGNVYTNTIEGFFSIFKRGVIGTFHHVSEQHLQRYLHEFDFRYNHRETRVKDADGKWMKAGYSDAERAAILLKGISHKRLTYRRINEAA
jgi:transposase-like protein